MPELDVLRPRIARANRGNVCCRLKDEVKDLRARYPGFVSTTARQAIGYKEVLDFLDGYVGLDEAKAAVTLATARYAKRQRTWFRKEALRTPQTTTVLEGLAKDFEAEALDWLRLS